MKKVSIIIPVYNGEKYISQALESVLMQTYSEFEVIIVDDGSTDATKSSVASYNDSRIAYFYKENGGLSSARNYGIQLSVGEYIAFLDADDIWQPEKLQKQVDFLDSHPDFGIVGCDFQFMNDEGKLFGIVRMRKFYPQDGVNLANLLKHSFLLPSSIMVRKNVIDDVGVFDPGFDGAEDIEFFLRVFKKYPLGIVDDVLLRYRIGHPSLSRGFRSYQVREKVFDRFFQDAPVDFEAVKADAYYGLYYNHGKDLLWAGRTAEARVYLRKACRNKMNFALFGLYIKSILKDALIFFGFLKTTSHQGT